MKAKSLLFVLVAALVVLPCCTKKEKTVVKTDDVKVTEVNDFTKNLSLVEGCFGKSSKDVVASLQKTGFKSAEESDGKINASDTIGNVICSFYSSSTASGIVNYITLEMMTTSTKSYVDNAEKLAEAVKAVGEKHNYPSGTALAFSDFSYGGSTTGNSWSEMVAGLGTLGETTNAVFNWKNSGTTSGSLSIIRNVVAEGTSVKYLLRDGAYTE